MPTGTLTGQTPAQTYKSLLKVQGNANEEISSSLKTIEDGNGNDTALQVSSLGIKSTGTLEVTGNTTLSGNLAVTGNITGALTDITIDDITVDTLTATTSNLGTLGSAVNDNNFATTNTNIDSGDIANAVVINKSPVITLAGDLSGSVTLTNLASNTLTASLVDITGTGSVVRATSPTLITPALGTPTSGALTNCTLIPSAQLTGTIDNARLPSAISVTSLTLGGDLTVNGTTTTINSTTLSVDDKNIELGSVTSPTDVTANGGGITLKGATDKTILWDSTNLNFTSSEHLNIPTGKSFKINNVSLNDVAETLTNKSLTSPTITGTGTIQSGQITSSGSITGTSLLTSSNGALNIGTGTITSGAINGQTISASANFTGTLSVNDAGSYTINDAGTNTLVDVLTLSHTTSGTAVSPIGAGLLFKSERASGGINLSRGGIYGIAGTDIDDDGDLSFYTLTSTAPNGFTEKMRITSAGLVGIGVTSPSVALHIQASTPQIRLRTSSYDSYDQISANGGNLEIHADEGNTFGGSFIKLKVDGSEAMRITSAGNVGIGVTPTDKLTILHSASNTGMDFAMTDGSGTSAITWYEKDHTVSDGYQASIGVAIQNGTDTTSRRGDLIFQVKKTGTALGTRTEVIRLDGDDGSTNISGNATISGTLSVSGVSSQMLMSGNTAQYSNSGLVETATMRIISGYQGNGSNIATFQSSYNTAGAGNLYLSIFQNSTSEMSIQSRSGMNGSVQTLSLNPSGGNTTIGGSLTTNGQIVFPATQNASAGANTLDHYEEGTWTPTFITQVNMSGATWVSGKYTIIGNIVTLVGTFNCTITTANILTYCRITIINNPAIQSNGMAFANNNIRIGNFQVVDTNNAYAFFPASSSIVAGSELIQLTITYLI